MARKEARKKFLEALLRAHQQKRTPIIIHDTGLPDHIVRGFISRGYGGSDSEALIAKWLQQNGFLDADGEAGEPQSDGGASALRSARAIIARELRLLADKFESPEVPAEDAESHLYLFAKRTVERFGKGG